MTSRKIFWDRNNSVFFITLKNVKEHRNIKFVITETIWYQNQIIILQVFHRKFVSNGNEKNPKLINKTVYLDFRLYIWVFVWLVKPKYGEKAKLCYMDTGSLIICIKTDDIYKDIAEDVETRFDTSSYESERALLKEKNSK